MAAFEKLQNGTVSPSTLSSLQETFPSDWPNLEYLVLDAFFGDGSEESLGAKYSTQYVAASVGLVSTFSRGNVTINSSDTSVNPLVSPNWLLDEHDQEMAVEAFKRGRALLNTDFVKPVVRYEAYPGANVTTDDQILAVCKRSVNSVYNAAATNKMGRLNDSMTVIDSKARVLGVDGLRVVDASSFPFLPPGQPSATVCKSILPVINSA